MDSQFENYNWPAVPSTGYDEEDTNESTFSELNIDWHEISVKLAQEKAEAQQRSLSAPIVFTASTSPPSSSRSAARGGTSGRKPSRCPVKRARQRNAANQRERKRMRTINEAFIELGDRIPHAPSGRKMSKVDTLRLAIDYIHQLSAMLNTLPTPNTPGGGGGYLGDLQDAKAQLHSQCETQGYAEMPYSTHDQYQSGEPVYFNQHMSWPADTPTTNNVIKEEEGAMFNKVWEAHSEQHVTTIHDMTSMAIL